MNRFNIKRFGHLALWTLREARQEMVTYGVVLTALYAAIIFLFLWGSKGENLDGQQMSMFLPLLLWRANHGMLICACLTSRVGSRSVRESLTGMEPALNGWGRTWFICPFVIKTRKWWR